MPYKDSAAQKAYLHEYQKSYHQDRYQKCLTKMFDYLGGKCVICGATDNLEFDHVDPSTKCFAITRRWNRKWDILQPELDKCQLLCKKHHLEKTYPNYNK